MQGWKVLPILSTKKKPAATGEEEGRIRPAARELVMYVSIASLSGLERLYAQTGYVEEQSEG